MSSAASTPSRRRMPPAESAVDAKLGIHCHNDAECGVANSLAAVAEGALLVQGTMNGYGERCGNANLISIIPALELKLGYESIGRDRLRRLTETAHLVDEEGHPTLKARDEILEFLRERLLAR